MDARDFYEVIISDKLMKGAIRMNEDKKHVKYILCNIIQKIGLLICGISVVYFAVQLALFNSTLMWKERMSLPYMKFVSIITLIALIVVFISTKLKKEYK